jgi:spore coat polysaccharide biosynthesis predicted glycosyltransferase SpsG/RimJ/RimL family protein N-acetyltransferase
MLEEEFECIFLMKEFVPEATLEIEKSGGVCKKLELNDGEEEATVVKDWVQPGDIVVLDGYAFTTNYQEILKAASCLVVCIDDIHAYHFVADAVINHAGGLDPEIYEREFYTQLYLGPEYAMLRQPFWNKGSSLQKNSDEVLVIFGGADPDNATMKILRQCLEIEPTKKYHIVVGAAYQYSDTLKLLRDEHPKTFIEIQKNISAEKLAELMQKAGVAITSPSTVAFEYLSIGGALFLYPIADNQKDVYNYFISHKLARSFDKFSGSIAQDKSIRKLDHDFVGNIRKIFNVLKAESQIQFRRATPEDAMLIFDWVNDLDVRRQSYQQQPIPWDTHVSWYNNKLVNNDCGIYLFFLDDVPIGQVRFDETDGEAVVSYLVAKAWRGRGFGTILLKKAILILRSEHMYVNRVKGYVKKENRASSCSFLKLGFKEKIALEYPESFVYTLELKR